MATKEIFPLLQDVKKMFNLDERSPVLFFLTDVIVHFHILSYSAATHRVEGGVKDYMLQNYNNLINSDVICCQK